MLTSYLSVAYSYLMMVPTTIWFVVLAVGYYIFQLYTNQENFLYFPVIPGPYGLQSKLTSENPPPYNSPANQPFNLDYEDIYITTLDNVKIHMWLIHAPTVYDYTTAPTIVFFHANAGNMGLRLHIMENFVKKLSCNVLAVEYRGYGNSEGTPSEGGLENDADAAMLFLRNRQDINPHKIFIYGQSLGGAVAIRANVNHMHMVAGLIVENTFTSIPEMVDHLMPLLRPLRPWILRLKWPSIDIIHRIDNPILFISALKDELVPPIMMKRLHDAAKVDRAAAEKDSVEIYTVPDAGHGDCMLKAGDAYYDRMNQFIYKYLRVRLGSMENALPRRLGEKEYAEEVEQRSQRQSVAQSKAQREYEKAVKQQTEEKGEKVVPSTGKSSSVQPPEEPPSDVVPSILPTRVHLTANAETSYAEGAEELLHQEQEQESHQHYAQQSIAEETDSSSSTGIKDGVRQRM